MTAALTAGRYWQAILACTLAAALAWHGASQIEATWTAAIAAQMEDAQ